MVITPGVSGKLLGPFVDNPSMEMILKRGLKRSFFRDERFFQGQSVYLAYLLPSGEKFFFLGRVMGERRGSPSRFFILGGVK